MAADGDAPDFYNVIVPLPASVPDADASAFAPMLTDEAVAFAAMREDGDHRKGWILTWTFDGRPEHALLQSGLGNAVRRVEAVPKVNWLEHSYRAFPAFRLGPFFIYGSHHTGAPPPDALPLLIDAATAFGSGEHGTTAGCMRALALLAERGMKPERILDLGTGSGILAIAAARLWPNSKIVATDIDAEAVRVCNIHAVANNAGDQITAVVADGFNDSALRGSFDVVIANILAGPLLAMGADIVGATVKDGRIILSGLLVEQDAEITKCYQSLGAALEERFVQDPWVALLWRKP